MKRLALILVSGWACGTESMAPLAGNLTSMGRVDVISLADLNRQCKVYEQHRNAREDSDCGMSPYARGIAKRIETSNCPVCLIGWSTGGMAVLEVAARCPEQLAGAVLLSTTARFVAAEDYPMGVPVPALRAMRLGLRKDPEAVLADFFRRSALPGTIPGEGLLRKVGDARAYGVDELAGGLDYLKQTDLRGILKNVIRPCLVVHGKEDRIIPWTAGQYLGRNLKDARTVFVPGAGHALPELFTSDAGAPILKFLEKLP